MNRNTRFRILRIVKYIFTTLMSIVAVSLVVSSSLTTSEDTIGITHITEYQSQQLRTPLPKATPIRKHTDNMILETNKTSEIEIETNLNTNTKKEESSSNNDGEREISAEQALQELINTYGDEYNDGWHAMPVVSGLSEQAAQSIIKNAGFDVKIYYYPSSTVPKGFVISCPEENQVMKFSKGEWKGMRIYVSTGPDESGDVISGVEPGENSFLMAQFVGDSLECALAFCRTYDLIVTLKEDFSDVYKDGQVMVQSIAPAIYVPIGSKITITVSLGTKVTVPNVVGLTTNEAIRKLNDAGLIYQQVVCEYNFDGIAKGYIVSQSIAPGSIIGTQTIMLTESDGPGALVPNVIGLSREDAKSSVESHSLRFTYDYRACDNAPYNTVIDQRLEAGSITFEGATCSVIISEGPGACVPNVVGLTEAEAQSLLSGAGFQYQTNYEYQNGNSNTAPSGIVYRQSLRAGDLRGYVNVVTFYVSLGEQPLSE